MEDKFFLHLYSPSAWEAVPNTKYSIHSNNDIYPVSFPLWVYRYELDRFERVVCMKVIKLRSQETMTGRKEFIVIGSTSVCGEDTQCKGKVCTTTTDLSHIQFIIFNVAGQDI